MVTQWNGPLNGLEQYPNTIQKDKTKQLINEQGWDIGVGRARVVTIFLELDFAKIYSLELNRMLQLVHFCWQWHIGVKGSTILTHFRQLV